MIRKRGVVAPAIEARCAGVVERGQAVGIEVAVRREMCDGDRRQQRLEPLFRRVGAREHCVVRAGEGCDMAGLHARNLGDGPRPAASGAAPPSRGSASTAGPGCGDCAAASAEA